MLCVYNSQKFSSNTVRCTDMFPPRATTAPPRAPPSSKTWFPEKLQLVMLRILVGSYESPSPGKTLGIRTAVKRRYHSTVLQDLASRNLLE